MTRPSPRPRSQTATSIWVPPGSIVCRAPSSSDYLIRRSRRDETSSAVDGRRAACCSSRRRRCLHIALQGCSRARSSGKRGERFCHAALPAHVRYPDKSEVLGTAQWASRGKSAFRRGANVGNWRASEQAQWANAFCTSRQVACDFREEGRLQQAFVILASGVGIEDQAGADVEFRLP